ncbi:biotin--[acetyl-CoA-carboxylase] ligase [Aggregatilineales bacterium SYSU G02658]
MLNEETLRAALGPRPFQFHQSVASTNDLAAEWLRAGVPTGAVVIADEQRAGRGRHGRTWHTPPGAALALSVVLRPDEDRAFLSSMIGALAVADLCSGLGLRPLIKWPNDVQINGLKVSGVLPEAIWSERRLLGVVLGIGVNVRVQFEGELAQQAVSLEAALGRRLARAALIAEIVQQVDHYSQQPPADVLGCWRAQLGTLGQRVRVGAISGVAVDTDPTGALLVRTDTGRVERVIAGDVALVKE